MDNTLHEVITGILTLLTGGGLAILTKFGIDRYQARRTNDQADKKVDVDVKITQNKADVELKQNQESFAFQALKSVLVLVQEDVKILKQDMAKMEQEHMQCREENAALKAEIRFLRNEHNELAKVVNSAST